MSEVNLVGLASNLENEDRALAHLEVFHNNTTYQWQVFIPREVENLSLYIESIKQHILNDIDSKESVWAALDPKTRIIRDPMTGQDIQIEISKDEIVRADIPDYYSSRRNEYPSLGDQLDAFWKGPESQEYLNMKEKILSVKNKYPKPY